MKSSGRGEMKSRHADSRKGGNPLRGRGLWVRNVRFWQTNVKDRPGGLRHPIQTDVSNRATSRLRSYRRALSSYLLPLMINLMEPTFHLSTPNFSEFFRVVTETSINRRCCVSQHHLHRPRRLSLGRRLLYKVGQDIKRSPSRNAFYPTHAKLMHIGNIDCKAV